MKKIAFIVFLFVGAISMVVMSIHYFQSDTAGILKQKEVANRLWYLFSFRTHILFGLIAIGIGPLQFIEKLRNTYTSFHRTIGYIYTVCILCSSVTGLVIAQFAMGGWITALGFSLLSLVWLYTIIKAVYAIRNGAIATHKKWMFLNYGLTAASITQRSLLLIPLLTEISFIPIYRLSAWLPWLLNGFIAYSIYKRSQIQNEIEAE